MLPASIKEVFERATCLYTLNEVEAAVDRMAKEITARLQETNPVLLSVMIGGLLPTAAVLRRLNFPLELDYIHVTRYRGETQGGELYWKVIPGTSLKGRTVLVIDDILDGGVTLAAILDFCHKEGAKQTFTSVLVDKKTNRAAEGIERADFTGLEVEDRYVFGYGMDYRDYLRNAQGIYAVDEQHQ